MNTAYRVWDGEQMYYWDEPGMSLEIIGTHWFLRNMDNKGHKKYVTGSHEEGTALMWGTGLKDKNEKMIYEYDIDMIDGEPMVVVRAGGKLGLKIPGDFDYHIDDCIDWDECNIGGDIYQNPELLEGAE
ncbi:YopX family protein [Bacillus vallismortis]|uniref:YopX family protein n=1 Tax=Bacillus vallismortis TaxID=72361 RepID=A0AAP3CHQ8_BACVA|nr:YopX family protein [Bacillus vallismortis]MCY8315795.1 YopX family protein [Bacillus vallismortis]